MLIGLLAALGAAVVYGGASILQAQAVREVAGARGIDPRLLLTLLRRPLFDLALAGYLIGFVLHFVALRLLPLYLAQAGIAASLAITAVLAVRVFGDRLRGQEWAAVAAVSLGLVGLSGAGGHAGGSDAAGTGVVAGLVVAVVLMLLIGGVAARRTARAWTAVLGSLAGVGYAVVGISGRLVPDVGPDLVSSPYTYLLCAGGTLAFLLYSIALQRGEVTAVTGPMVVVQTAAPSLIGIWLLGDSVRDGWWPVAVLGFLAAGAGTLALIRFEAVRTETVSHLGADRAAG